MKNYFAALLIVFVSLSFRTQAADEVTTAATAARSNALSTVAHGATITSNNQQYEMLQDVFAAKGMSRELPQDTLSRVGGGQLIETKGAYVVYKSTQQTGVNSTGINAANSFPTVLNKQTGVTGILPGTICVKLKNFSNSRIVASDHGLTLVKEFAHLQTVFYSVQTGQDVVTATASLNADSRVLSAEAEVIEHMRVPN
jgi:hypothetical protein